MKKNKKMENINLDGSILVFIPFCNQQFSTSVIIICCSELLMIYLNVLYFFKN